MIETVATWVAPVATTIAALMTASNLGSRVTGYGFIVFTVGSLAWLALGISTGQANLLWQNVILTALNLFGIWRWLGRQATIEQGGVVAQQQSGDLDSETLFPASLLTKAKVIGTNGDELGTTVEAMLGCRSGQPSYLVVAQGWLAGVGETLRRVEWRDARVDGDRLVATLDPAAFERCDKLTKDQWPGR
jgi:PRC-barrel domain